MKIGGGLSYVVGPMGSGKSYYGVRKILGTLMTGGYAVTNVELGYWDAGHFRPHDPRWADLAARHIARTAPWKRRRVADKLRSLYIYEPELQEAMRYRLPGVGEARGLFMWDETHNDLSNRNWRDAGRQEILEWATQLRKLGFAGYLLSQHQENTEAQLRRVCNYIVRLQNQREQTRLLGMRVTPWPLFLAVWHPSHVPLNQGRAVKPVRIERYFLGWHRRLYDTHGLYHGLAGDTRSDVVLLPPGGRVAPQALPAAE